LALTWRQRQSSNHSTKQNSPSNQVNQVESSTQSNRRHSQNRQHRHRYANTPKSNLYLHLTAWPMPSRHHFNESKPARKIVELHFVKWPHPKEGKSSKNRKWCSTPNLPHPKKPRRLLTYIEDRRLLLRKLQVLNNNTKSHAVCYFHLYYFHYWFSLSFMN
jgi:hypothetical protein